MIALTIAIATILLLLYLGYSLIFSKKNIESKIETSSKEENNEKQTKTNSKQHKQVKITNINKKDKSKELFVFKHKWLLTTLKAHSGSVTSIDFSSNGKYLISSGNERAIFLWNCKEFDNPSQHKNVRCNVEFDHATKVRFTPDSKSFIASLGVANTVRAFKLTKKEDNSIQISPASLPDFQKKHTNDIINIGISCNAKFIMTISKETIINIWDLKGEVLGTVDSLNSINSFGAVSNCGRFFGACGFTSDVKVWEVCFDKNGSFKEIKKAFDLKGHSAGVYHFAYNSDTSRMATVSKDKTWKFWNTSVEYSKKQDPILLLTGHLDTIGNSLIALSQDSYSLVVAIENKLCFFKTTDAKCDNIIENVCVDSINEIQFSSDNKYLAVAGDRHIKIFHNITGFRVNIEDCLEKIKSTKSESTKDRLKETIEEFQNMINKIEKN